MSAALDRLQVRGYKSIREMDIRLTPLNVLIGANGAGKTNFISIFRLLNAIVDQRLQEFVARSGGANALLYFGLKRTEEVSLKLWLGENLYRAILSPDDDDALYFAKEIAYFWDKDMYDQPYKVPLGSGQRESRLKRSKESAAQYVLDKLHSWRLYHFHDTTASARVKLTGDLHDNRSLVSDAGNLAAFLLLLREQYEDTYKQIVDVVQLAAPFFNDFVLRPSPFDESKIRLEWTEKGSDSTFGPNDLSDGTLRFICLATALLQPKAPATLLIDEPELGLHPYAITLLASLMQSASQRMQVIVSTQSVPLVNQFSAEDLIVVDRLDGQSTFQRLESADLSIWLDDYGLGDLWEKNVLGGRPSHA
jgi:predicted ATPase